MRSERRFDLHDHPVVKTDVTDRKIFDRVGLVIPVRPHAHHFTGFVADVGPAVPGGGDRLRRTHEIVGHLHHVHTDVNHRPATLQLLLPEHTPVRNAATAKRLALHKHQVAELPLVTRLHQIIGLGVVAVLEPDRKLHIGGLGRGNHLLAFRRTHRHRLFHHDMTTRLGRGQGSRAVDSVRGADIHRVRLDHLEKIVPLLKALLRLHAVLLLVLLKPIRVDVAEADQFHLGNRLVGGHVRVADAAAADDRHAQFGRGLLRSRFLHRSLSGRNLFHGRCLGCHFSILSLILIWCAPGPSTGQSRRREHPHHGFHRSRKSPLNLV